MTVPKRREESATEMGGKSVNINESVAARSSRNDSLNQSKSEA